MEERRIYDNNGVASVSIYDVKEYPMHYHKNPEMIFVIRGAARVHTSYYTIDRVGENEFIFINSGTIHNIEQVRGETCRIMSIHFRMENINRLYNMSPVAAFSIASFDEYSSPEIISGLRRYLVNVAELFFRPDRDSGTDFSEAVLECYTYMINNFQWFYYDDYILHNYPQRIPLSQINRVEKVLDYIEERFRERVTLSQAADAFFLNKYYLSHLVKDTLGMSFQDILNAIRLNNALRPLLETKKSVEEIAEECGFSSASYMRKAFYVHAKLPLSAYRKRYGGRVLGVMAPDITEYDRKMQHGFLTEYRKIYYPDDLAVKNTERVSVCVNMRNPDMSEPLPQEVRELRLTPETLFHSDYLETAIETMDFSGAVASVDDFREISGLYGSWEFFEPTKRILAAAGVKIRWEACGENGNKTGAGEHIFPGLSPWISVIGGNFPMYTEKGLRTKWYYLYFMLNCLYDQVIFADNSCAITRSGNRIAIMCGGVKEAERKEIFLHVEDIECDYSIITYCLDLSSGGEEEMWRMLGNPGRMNAALMETMRASCFPRVTHTHYTVQYDLFRDITLEPGEVKLMVMIPGGNRDGKT